MLLQGRGLHQLWPDLLAMTPLGLTIICRHHAVQAEAGLMHRTRSGPVPRPLGGGASTESGAQRARYGCALLAVILKDLRQTFRDRRMAAMLIIAPVAQLILLGYAVDLDVDRIPTAICDQDRSPMSRALTRGLTADGTRLHVMDTVDPERPLREGQARVV